MPQHNFVKKIATLVLEEVKDDYDDACNLLSEILLHITELVEEDEEWVATPNDLLSYRRDRRDSASSSGTEEEDYKVRIDKEGFKSFNFTRSKSSK